MLLRLAKPKLTNSFIERHMSIKQLAVKVLSCSIIKFSLVTTQQMRCFVIKSSQLDSEYSLVRVLCGHRFLIPA